MKTRLLLLIFISFPILVAQELDESFLKSLPKDMQEDILKRSEGSGAAENPVYRSIESQTKLEKTKKNIGKTRKTQKTTKKT